MMRLMFISVFGLLLFSANTCKKESEENHREEIAGLRVEKDSLFKDPATTPIPEAERSSFKRLNYFPLDSAFFVKAKFEILPQPEVVNIAYTNGGTEAYTRYARLDFKLKGEKQSLFAYRSNDFLSSKEYRNAVFIPFMDPSNGRETYGGGRFLDVEIPEDEEMMLDFNLAYNPYCAYNAEYTCPIPPRENLLGVPVLAGEKNYNSDKAN
ncbi:MAG: DUF1684 domain-containing protein [Bacteroidia bacterium]